MAELQGSACDSKFGGVFEPSHLGEHWPNIEGAAAFLGTEDDERHHSITVVALALLTAMDIWHADNQYSPGHQSILSQLGRQSRKAKRGAPVYKLKVDVAMHA